MISRCKNFTLNKEIRGDKILINGIAIVGLNGAGKSTLAHALAKEIGYFEMDVEDYYFPEQRTSRQNALENQSLLKTEYLGELPYSMPRTKAEVQEQLLKDIEKHSKFIISGVTMNWCEEILSRIDIVFWIQTPTEVRVERVKEREERRFGERVLENGDMYLQQVEFRKMVADKKLETVEKSIAELKKPIIVLDGMVSVEKNLEIVKNKLELYCLIGEGYKAMQEGRTSTIDEVREKLETKRNV